MPAPLVGSRKERDAGRVPVRNEYTKRNFLATPQVVTRQPGRRRVYEGNTGRWLTYPASILKNILSQTDVTEFQVLSSVESETTAIGDAFAEKVDRLSVPVCIYCIKVVSAYLLKMNKDYILQYR